MKNICVFCGSSTGEKSVYAETAVQLGEYLAEKNITLVYGGSGIGLMGKIAETVMNKGGRAVGVIPRAISDRVRHLELTELHIVETMHQRKQKMFEMADAFLAFPGGIGTLEEIFEMLTWNQLGFHVKPCAFFNIADYYRGLFDFLHSCAAEGFINGGFIDSIIFSDSLAEILNRMKDYRAPEKDKFFHLK